MNVKNLLFGGLSIIVGTISLYFDEIGLIGYRNLFLILSIIFIFFSILFGVLEE